MTEEQRAGWGTILVIILFIIYEAITAIFQFVFFITSDLMELGFDLIFILILVFFYDVDALILLIELIPLVDLIPLFAIYMFMKLATLDQPRHPLIEMDWFNMDKAQTSTLAVEPPPKVLPTEDKVFQAVSNEEVCVICMQPLEDLDEIIECPNGHLAHVTHIQPWTEAMDREYCPVCRVKYPRVLISKTYLKSGIIDL
jgi:hypothetical protein